MFALLLCAVVSLHATTGSPELTQQQIEEGAIDAIASFRPDRALEYYADLTEEKRQERVLSYLVDTLKPADLDAEDDIPALITAIENWNRAHLTTKKIELPSVWRVALTAKSPFLDSVYNPKHPSEIDKPPVKVAGPPIPAGMVRLYSADNRSFDLLRIYATNPAISEWLSNIFKDTSRTTIKLANVAGGTLAYLVGILDNIGHLWEWALKNFDTKAEQEAQIVKTIDGDLNTRDVRLADKIFIDTNILDMIKAADTIKAPLALRLYQQRLECGGR